MSRYYVDFIERPTHHVGAPLDPIFDKIAKPDEPKQTHTDAELGASLLGWTYQGLIITADGSRRSLWRRDPMYTTTKGKHQPLPDCEQFPSVEVALRACGSVQYKYDPVSVNKLSVFNPLRKRAKHTRNKRKKGQFK